MTDESQILKRLPEELDLELRSGILPFWMEKMTDHENGGFYGRIDGEGHLHPQADKGVILTSRILWAFSAAYRHYKDEKYLETARRAADYLIEKFWDKQYGGVYWMLDYRGEPKDTKKQTYAQGFALYGLSEYYMACGDARALEKAEKLFRTIEKHTFDTEKDGYLEAFTREWKFIEDMRLSNKDENAPKTMNTHLHIIEPYSNLYQASPSPRLKERIAHLLELFTGRLLNRNTGRLGLFFDMDWNPVGEGISYGHDIEAAWLLEEAARSIGEEKLIEKTLPLVEEMTLTSLSGIDRDGAMSYHYTPSTGVYDREKHWWVQAEAIVGLFNLYEKSRDPELIEKISALWDFIKTHLKDRQEGEWYWGIKPDGTVNTLDDKAGFWKCPYHNTRMCLEMIRRIRKISTEKTSNL